MLHFRPRREPVAVFESNRNAAVYAYYIDIRGDRPMPPRAEIDPIQLKKHLPYLYMAKVDRDEAGDVRFKLGLMGTELVEILKQEGKDQFVRELDLGGFEQVWRESLLCSYSSKAPVVALDQVRMSSGLELDFEHLVLPLSDDGEDVDRMLGCFDFPRVSEGWLRENLLKVDWAGGVEVEVPKRVLITNMKVPID